MFLFLKNQTVLYSRDSKPQFFLGIKKLVLDLPLMRLPVPILGAEIKTFVFGMSRSFANLLVFMAFEIPWHFIIRNFANDHSVDPSKYDIFMVLIRLMDSI